MTTVIELSAARAQAAKHPDRFVRAFNDALAADASGEDTARFLRTLTASDESATAGFLEGLAAARALAGAVIPTRKRAYYKQRKPGVVRRQAALEAAQVSATGLNALGLAPTTSKPQEG